MEVQIYKNIADLFGFCTPNKQQTENPNNMKLQINFTEK
jgi:hypothetical protein